MKRNDFNEMKGLDIKSLAQRAKKIKQEIGEAILDKNMSKLKDLRTISKKRRDLAQTLTVLRQKVLLEELEGTKTQEEVKEPKTESKDEAKSTKSKSKVKKSQSSKE